METFVLQLNSGICCLIPGTTFGTFLPVSVGAPGLNPAAGRAGTHWSSGEERSEKELEDLVPSGQEPGFACKACFLGRQQCQGTGGLTASRTSKHGTNITWNSMF